MKNLPAHTTVVCAVPFGQQVIFPFFKSIYYYSGFVLGHAPESSFKLPASILPPRQYIYLKYLNGFVLLLDLLFVAVFVYILRRATRRMLNGVII